MSVCIQEAGVARQLRGISRDELIRLSTLDKNVQWKEVCDVRPDACGKFRKLFPEGYLQYDSGSSGKPYVYSLDKGVLYATSFDSDSIAVLDRLANELNATVFVRPCNVDESTPTFPLATVLVVVLGVVALLMTLWVMKRLRK